VSSSLASPLVAALALHYDELVSYVRQRFAGRDCAHDAVHAVCVRVLEAPHAADVHTPLAYLRRAVLHQAIDFCRHDDVRAALIESRAEPPEAFAAGGDGEAALAFKREVQALARIVEAMPPRARQVFLLHCVHGMGHQEIAEAIGVTRSMVSHHAARALRDVALRWAPARALYRSAGGV
jgi:RNA polymerase sigma-70 factor (ECF subfamily)